MTRSFSCEALVIRARPSGESNREVSFLSADEGILRATVFGGPKSRLRAHAAPWHQGRVWFYRDPAKDFFKVTDFDVRLWRPGLRESYSRSMAATSVAETLLASGGGGGAWSEALDRSAATLDALEDADDEKARRIALIFLWNWTDFLGARPDIACCASCGERVSATGILWYSRREEQLLCASCAGTDPAAPRYSTMDDALELLPVHPGTRRWLEAVATATPRESARYGLERSLEGEARSLVQAILAAALGKRLSTWDW